MGEPCGQVRGWWRNVQIFLRHFRADECSIFGGVFVHHIFIDAKGLEE